MPARVTSIASIFCLAVLLAGCSDDEQHAHPEDEHELSDVVFVGKATDEALEYLLDRPAKDSESERLTIDSPEAGATLSKDEAPTIAYHSAVSGRLEPRPLAPSPYVRPPWPRRAIDELVGLFGPLRSAHAHGAPFSGLGYYLELVDGDGKRLLRVFTDERSYTPELATWSQFADVAQPIELTIVSAAFEQNEIPSGGGPFLGARIDFTVE